MWKLIRLLFLALWLFAGSIGEFQRLPLTVSSFLAIGAAFLFGAFGTRFHVFCVYKSKPPDELWLLPSWAINPFQSGQPFLLFDLAALSFVLFAAAAAARVLLLPLAADGLPSPLFVGALGSGMWFGIRLAVHSYKERFRAC
jgi:hypothetical protein